MNTHGVKGLGERDADFVGPLPILRAGGCEMVLSLTTQLTTKNLVEDKQ